MSIIIPANSAVAGGFDITNGCRFDRASSDYLSRSFSGSRTGSGTKFTFSTWIKRSQLGTDQTICYNYGSSVQFGYLYFRGSQKDVRYFDRVDGGDTCVGTSAPFEFNDNTAWYHFVLQVDTTLGTGADRVKLYVNGVFRAFAFDNTPNQDQALNFGAVATRTISSNYGGGNYFDGYQCETIFIDGQALQADSFGEFDGDSGIWKPINVSGLTFGSIGFYLEYQNSGALGTDSSGGSNTFTAVNIAAINQTTDTCTNNFATMNSLDAYWSASTFEDGNCTIIMPETTNETYTRATMGVNSGKWYWEALCTVQNSTMNAGIVDSPAIATNTELGKRPKGLSWNDSGSLNGNDTQVFNGTQAPAYSTSQIISFAMDLDNNFLYLRLAGSYTNSGNPESGASGTGGAAIPTNPSSGFYFPAFGDSSTSGGRYQVNFGNSPFAISSGNTDGNDRGNFEYTVPSGYLALCTKNLSGELS